MHTWLKRGDVGLKWAREHRERRESGGAYTPRFWLRAGEEAEVVVLSTRAELTFAEEHAVPGEGMNWRETREYVCPGPMSCPVCAKVGTDDRFRKPYSAMYLTVFDTRDHTPKDGGAPRPYGRRLLVIKSMGQDRFIELIEACAAKHGDIRGMVLNLRRGTDQTAPRTGEPAMVENADGRMYDWDPDFVRGQDTDVQAFDLDKVLDFTLCDEAGKGHKLFPAGPSAADTDSVWEDEEETPPAPPKARTRRRTAEPPKEEPRTRRTRARAAPAADVVDSDDIPF